MDAVRGVRCLVPVVPGCSRRLAAVYGTDTEQDALAFRAVFLRVVRVFVEGFVESLVPHLLVAFDAAGVDAEQDLDAVAGPAGDFGSGDRVEGEGYTAVAEVVG